MVRKMQAKKNLVPLSDLTILDHKDMSAAGIACRRPNPGPELELVHGFLNSAQLSIPNEMSGIAFVEPRISSGYPDVLVVTYNKTMLDKSIDIQRKLDGLTLDEYKVLSLIFELDDTSQEGIECCFVKPINKSLDSLEHKGLVALQSSGWALSEECRSSLVSQIFAFEAKTTGSEKVFSQAFKNRWYSNKSYVVTPKKLTMKGQKRASELGVHSWSLDSRHTIDCCNIYPSPKSYLAWEISGWVLSVARNTDKRLDRWI